MPSIVSGSASSSLARKFAMGNSTKSFNKVPKKFQKKSQKILTIVSCKGLFSCENWLEISSGDFLQIYCQNVVSLENFFMTGLPLPSHRRSPPLRTGTGLPAEPGPVQCQCRTGYGAGEREAVEVVLLVFGRLFPHREGQEVRPQRGGAHLSLHNSE